MSRGRHTIWAPHWPSPDDVLEASPQDISAVATAYRQGVEHREVKGQPVPKARMFEAETELVAGHLDAHERGPKAVVQLDPQAEAEAGALPAWPASGPVTACQRLTGPRSHPIQGMET